MRKPLVKGLLWVVIAVAVLGVFPRSAAAQCDGAYCAEVVFSCWRCVTPGTGGDPNRGCVQLSACWCEDIYCSLPAAARNEPAKSALALLGFVPNDVRTDRCSV